eukprot:TRINITY_DN2788_c0_g1_i2.p1 TRINITY_DN2788_c0_g1~~TRINITY_DN2788_c0_g1_i2.p1  ORF type:complete len:661 (-),score=87.85 TRINITY_DN2788_c0_g1_i2:37-2019(-)
MESPGASTNSRLDSSALYPRDARSGLPIIPIPLRYSGRISGDRVTHYLSPVLKVSRKGKPMERLMMITDKYLYLLKGEEQTITRCIGITEMQSIQIPQDNDQAFLISCDRSVNQQLKQHDLAVDRCTDRAQVVGMLQTLHRCWTGRDLSLVVVGAWRSLEQTTRVGRTPTKEYNATTAIRPATPIHHLGDKLLPGGSPPTSPRPTSPVQPLSPDSTTAGSPGRPPRDTVPQWPEDDEPVPPPLSPSGAEEWGRRPGLPPAPLDSAPASPDLRLGAPSPAPTVLQQPSPSNLPTSTEPVQQPTPPQQQPQPPTQPPEQFFEQQQQQQQFYELELASQQRQIQRLYQSVQETQAELAQRDSELRTLRDELNRTQRDAHQARELVQQRDHDIRRLQEQLSQAREDSERHRQLGTDALRDATALQSAQAEVQRLRQELSDLHGQQQLLQQHNQRVTGNIAGNQPPVRYGTPSRSENSRDAWASPDSHAGDGDLRGRLVRARELYDSLCARMTAKDAEIRQLWQRNQNLENELHQERSIAEEEAARRYDDALAQRDAEIAALRDELQTQTASPAHYYGYDSPATTAPRRFLQSEREALLQDVNELRLVSEQRQLEIERLKERERDAHVLQDQNSRLLALLPHSPQRTQEEVLLSRFVHSASRWRV